MQRSAEYGPLTIAYDERVLAPRLWTLMHSEWASEVSPRLPAGPILELCAGAGHIGLLAAYETRRPLVQVECDPIAAAYATRNARAASVCAYEMRVTTLRDAVFPGESFPLIIADPPYLPTADIDGFPDDPRAAIDGGDDGLDRARECIAIAATALAYDGVMLLQVRGAAQAKELGLDEVRTYDDERAVALLTLKQIEQLVIG